MTAGLGVSAAPRAARPGVVEPDEIAFLRARGWSAPALACEPKVAALRALESLPAPGGVQSVSYVSRGNVLIVTGRANAARAREAAVALSARLPVTLLAPQPIEGQAFASWSGSVDAISGHLGEFTVTLSALRMGASAPASKPTEARFDLVLDLADEPLFRMRQPPQGYFRPHDGAFADALAEVAAAVGEFEKPRFFAYRENICAHSRSEIVGCDKCIEICSTGAISSDGNRVKVDPHLCMGCGACSTVCPSGAMSYQFPRLDDRGREMKAMLAAYRAAGGEDACIVFHNGEAARTALIASALSGEGLPAHALPVEAWHVASVGLDLLLPAIAFGASQVAVLVAGEDAEYVRALREQMEIGETILHALGYDGRHFLVVEAGGAGSIAPGFVDSGVAATVAVPAAFALGNDKRTAIEFAVEHLAKHAALAPQAIALPAGAPFGEVVVDAAKCTMCMSCVGACPESALMDGVEEPLLKFLERNCVQCGLCESTCPEEAISLSARLLLTPAVREARVLNATQPFHCIRCSKPFGTRQMVDAMMGRLAGHSMFTQGSALKRLQMCADCRVVDMMSSREEMSILKQGAGS